MKSFTILMVLCMLMLAPAVYASHAPPQLSSLGMTLDNVAVELNIADSNDTMVIHDAMINNTSTWSFSYALVIPASANMTSADLENSPNAANAGVVPPQMPMLGSDDTNLNISVNCANAMCTSTDFAVSSQPAMVAKSEVTALKMPNFDGLTDRTVVNGMEGYPLKTIQSVSSFSGNFGSGTVA